MSRGERRSSNGFSVLDSPQSHTPPRSLKPVQEDSGGSEGTEVPDGMELEYSQPFSINLSRGGSVHTRVVYYEFLDALIRLGPPVHSLEGDDLMGREDRSPLHLFRPILGVLFGSPEDYGRYSVVKEFPYYHFESYPEGVDVEPIYRYIDENMDHPSERYYDQELGDVDVAVLDRKTRTAYVTEVKTKREYLADAASSIRKFNSYGIALGWDVEAEVVVFEEEESFPEDLIIDGSIERYGVPEVEELERHTVV